MCCVIGDFGFVVGLCVDEIFLVFLGIDGVEWNVLMEDD